jgi:tetratricopeptide (TPR) repeat protein
MKMSRILNLSVLALAAVLSTSAQAGLVPEQAIKDADAGYFKKALAQIQPLAAAHPQDAELQYRYGQALLATGKPEEAMAAFKAAIDLDPKNGVYHRALGEAYGYKAQKGFASGSEGMFGMMGLMKSARGEFELAEQYAPEDVQAHVNLAMFYIMVPGIMGGSYSKAHDEEATLDKLDPVQSLQVRSAEAGNKDKDDEAIKLLQQAIAQDKTQGSRLALGLFYIGAKRYDDAFATFREMSKDPTAYMAWYQIGKTSGLAKSNYDEGIASLKQYLAVEDLPDTIPSPAWAHYRLGNIYQAQGQKDLARGEYKTAAGLNSNGDPELVAKLKDSQAELK